MKLSLSRLWYDYDNTVSDRERFIQFLGFIALPYTVLSFINFYYGLLFGIIAILTREYAKIKFKYGVRK